MTIGNLVLINIYIVWTFFMWFNVTKHKWYKNENIDAIYAILWFLWFISSCIILGFTIDAITDSEIWNFKLF